MLVPYLVLLLFIVGGVVGALAALAGQLYERRKWELGLRTPQMGSSGVSVVTSDSIRLDRLEQAMDALAIELERIGEGQRFLTKLLADRSAASVSSLEASQPSRPPG